MECRLSEGEGSWELNRAALQMGGGGGGGETDTANERQPVRGTRERREPTSLGCVEVLDADIQQLLSLIPTNQKGEYEPFASAHKGPTHARAHTYAHAHLRPAPWAVLH